MFYKKHVYLFFFLIASLHLEAQEYWDLQKCINHALDNNLSIKQSVLNTKFSEQELSQSKAAIAPSINAFATNFYNFGQTIDPLSNQFASERVRSNQFGLNSRLTIFNGLQNYHTIKRNELNLSAARFDVDKSRNDISLAVANFYLQILLSEELVNVARNQIAITQRQVDQSEKLYRAGSIPYGSLLDVQAQLATEELSLVNAQNQVELSYLQLIQLLQLEREEAQKFRIVKPQISIELSAVIESRPNQIYDEAERFLPDIKSAETRLMGAEQNLMVAKGTRYPSLSLSGAFGTGYSGLRQELTGYSIGGDRIIGQTQSGELVTTPDIVPLFALKPFDRQMRENFNQSIGLTLSVPIFNNYTTRSFVNSAKITMEIRENELEITKNRVKQDIQQAFADATAALNNLKASEKAFNALQQAFKYNEQRFEAGVINPVEFYMAKTRLNNAEADLQRAKYNFIFRLKVLDFYQGKPISL
jgi:outer membrane protein